MLAALLLNANQPVTPEIMIDHIWEEPPKAARTVLQSLVLRLRRAFGEHEVICTRESGYLIEVSPGELDVNDARQLLAAAETAREVRDAAAERAHLATVLDLWRGPALADVPSTFLQSGDAVRLQELWFTALTRRIDLDLTFGRQAELVGELRKLTRVHPLREHLWAQLMTALYRCSRQAESLAVYQEVRQVLASDLGIEPGSELQELHQAILLGEPGLTQPTVPEPAAPPVDSWRDLCQLPPMVGDFVGREVDHDTLVEQLAGDSRTGPVVIWGMPGMGKTALAVHVAHSLRRAFPDGQWYVPLQNNAPSATGHPDLSEILAELLLVSGVPRSAIPCDLQTRASVWRSRLADRQVLLVLDDASTIDQITPLLPGTSTAAVLVTSRSALSSLPGAFHHRLHQLDLADSVAMLSRIVGERRVDAEPEAARRIATLCAGLPLALRILGARLATQPKQQLIGMADRMLDQQRRLDELSTSGLTVRAELRSSYRALDPDTQRAFRSLGLLGKGDFAARTIGALAGDSDGQRLVEQLTTAGLLEPTAADATGEPHYRLHDLVAIYAQELVLR
ncbi:AfsR/SARP family transcriptional regulator [Virgisporangium aurantiacum]|uniref:OmpR/PhoB-type domain-containing protein n=1 Tax=Virgisporangium aurantiacum TaxID=175570 RepID=A0A8J3ZDX0_9ACTN|nr:AfsR/SARP family transcriptional regulator [Virgisporangium aurantiacum]GIJ62174.1 hypothetical protein Vau01_096900 [Virgisporangium aurantiacum]